MIDGVKLKLTKVNKDVYTNDGSNEVVSALLVVTSGLLEDCYGVTTCVVLPELGW
jgi:hypothetical protein